MKIEITKSQKTQLGYAGLILLWLVILVWSLVDVALGNDVVINIIVSLVAVGFMVLDVRSLVKRRKIDKAVSV